MKILDGPSIHGFSTRREPDGSIRIDCVRAIARGVRPVSSEKKSVAARVGVL